MSEHARMDPSRTALVMGDASLSYGELDERARRLATVLEDLRAGPGAPVATVLRNGFEQFEIAMAASMVQAPYLPVNHHFKAAEIAYILSDAAVSVVVGDRDLAGELVKARDMAGSSARMLLVGEELEELVAKSPPYRCDGAGPGPELVFYTSGTTGKPKGIVREGIASNEARAAGLAAQADLWQWTPNDIYLVSGPTYHASHSGWVLTSLFVGATTVLTEKFEALSWLKAVQRFSATRSFMVPAHFIRILEVPPEERERIDLSSLKLIVHGAAPCPLSVKRKMMEAFPHVEIYELYGASEGGATRISSREWLKHPGSVGLPWPGVKISILDESGMELPAGKSGTIYITPPRGQEFTYRNDPLATKMAFKERSFTVGDIGYLDSAGYLYITDRASDMVLWGGVNIAPREIEEVLYDHPAVVDCAVFGVPDDRDGERLKAVVQLRCSATPEELADHVREHLAAYKVPREWEIVDELPRDQSGKIKKRLLGSQAAQSIPSSS
ncbi:MAG: AMP-binding protein [Actinobacteria bacterium]|nr:AMP-binding protein [Actinomycetota bacterium]